MCVSTLLKELKRGWKVRRQQKLAMRCKVCSLGCSPGETEADNAGNRRSSKAGAWMFLSKDTTERELYSSMNHLSAKGAVKPIGMRFQGKPRLLPQPVRSDNLWEFILTAVNSVPNPAVCDC